MANEQNLKPRTTLSKEEAKRLGSKGGKASAKAKRERKAIRDQLKALLELPVKNEILKKKIKELGISDKDIDNQMAITISIFNRALNGDTKAFEVIRDTIGEKPVEQIQNLNPPVIKLERPKK